MKLKDTVKISGVLEVVTGLHIGAGNEAVEIGGLDNQVIKNPMTHAPYIPGSSLKGKMRFITEWVEGKVSGGDVHACGTPSCPICRVFGTLKKSESGDRGPTRLIVRDANLIGDFNPETMLEVKYGTAIDRISGTAKGGSLRNIERVTPGTRFSFELIYKIFDMADGGSADEKNFKNMVVRPLLALENDTLGGSGSRGCGKVKFIDITVENGSSAGSYPTVQDLYTKVDKQ